MSISAPRAPQGSSTFPSSVSLQTLVSTNLCAAFGCSKVFYTGRITSAYRRYNTVSDRDSIFRHRVKGECPRTMFINVMDRSLLMVMVSLLSALQTVDAALSYVCHSGFISLAYQESCLPGSPEVGYDEGPPREQYIAAVEYTNRAPKEGYNLFNCKRYLYQETENDPGIEMNLSKCGSDRGGYIYFKNVGRGDFVVYYK